MVKTKAKRRIKSVKVPLYHRWFQMVVTQQDLPDNHLACVEVNMTGPIVLWIKPDAKLSVIVHEAVHVVNGIFKQVYHKISVDNDEPQAYLTEWVVGQIVGFLEKVKKDESNV